jgi:hypothetical protein
MVQNSFITVLDALQSLIVLYFSHFNLIMTILQCGLECPWMDKSVVMPVLEMFRAYIEVEESFVFALIF